MSFDEFWAVYPRREGRKEALKVWEKLNPSPALVQQILDALAWQSQTEQWTKDDGEFVPHAKTYLRNERWTDERRKADRRVSPQGIQYDCPHATKCASRWACGMRQLQERQAS